MKIHYIKPKPLHIMLVMALLFLLVVTVRAQDGGSFQETFDDPTLLGWEYSPGVSVVDGVLRVESDGFAFHSGQWPDLTLSLRARRTGAGFLTIRYSVSDTGAYNFGFGDKGMALLRNEGGTGTELAAAPVLIPADQWVQVSITVVGGVHTISLDGQTVLTATASQPLPPGGIALQAGGSATGEFDDLSLSSGVVTSPPAEVTPTSVPVTQGTESWIRLGGPPGGLGYDIRYNFADPNIWYVTDSNAGVHISTDNGYTWIPTNEGIVQKAGQKVGVFCLTVDPHDPQIIWIGTQNTGHIYKSTDGGQTWVPKEEGITMEYDAMSFRGFTVDPRTSDIVYAMAETSRFEADFGGINGVWGPGTGGVVYKTTDGGEHWQEIWDGGMPSSLARYLWINPQNPDILYVSTGIFDRGAVGEPADVDNATDPFGGLGILKSTDGGQTWRILNEANGLEHLYIGSLYMHPDDPDILLAAAGHSVPELTIRHYADVGHSPLGIYRTTDGGETWTQVLEPPAERSAEVFTAVEICPSDHNIAYAGSELAVYRSEDAGQTWALVSGGIDGWGPPGVRAGWPIDLQCDPRDPNRIFANNYSGGNFLSEDGGLTWSNASDGYSGALIMNVDVDPLDPSHVISAGRNGAWESYDSGLTWQTLQNLPDDLSRIGGEWGSVAFDRSRPGHILLGYESVLEHTDTGWQLHRMESFFFPMASDMVFAPSEASTVYLSVSTYICMALHANCISPGETSLVVSHDGGATWQDITGQTLANTAMMDLAVDPLDANVVYAAATSGLFKTTDGGASWVKMSGLPDGEFRTVAVSPVNSSFILTSIHEGGFYTSADGGVSWQQVTAGLEPNGSHHRIVFDPSNPQIVYTTDLFSGLYRSMDGGLTWMKLNPGYEIPVTGLAVSADGQHIYIGTSGSGVYRLDLNGVPPSASQ